MQLGYLLNIQRILDINYYLYKTLDITDAKKKVLKNHFREILKAYLELIKNNDLSLDYAICYGLDQDLEAFLYIWFESL